MYSKCITKFRECQHKIATGVYKQVRLTQGYVALVDASDFDRVNKYKWQAAIRKTTVYASTDIKGKKIMMHVFILGTKKGREIDHRNHKGLHNYRSNLRFCTKSQNAQNRRPVKVKYKGITLDRGRHKAQIYYKGSKIFIGYYSSPELAALAYDDKATELYGEFAHLNFPDRSTHTMLTGFFDPEIKLNEEFVRTHQ